MAATFLTEIPNLYNAKKILAIQPHYDDNDIAAGGTISGNRRLLQIGRIEVRKAV